jgi:predicted transcriptional regulator
VNNVGRTGRPKSEKPKSQSIKIRLDEETNDRLSNYAKKHEMKRTEVVRNGLNMILDSDK